MARFWASLSVGEVDRGRDPSSATAMPRTRNSTARQPETVGNTTHHDPNDHQRGTEEDSGIDREAAVIPKPIPGPALTSPQR